MFYCVQLADRVSVYSVDIVSVDALDYIDTFRKQTRFVHCHLKVREGFFKCFWKKSLMLIKAALIDQKYSKTDNIVKYNYNVK